MTLQPNPGDRPSRLRLARYHTGELTGADKAEVEAWLSDHPEGQAFLDELEAARAGVPGLDLSAVRRRAAQVADQAPAIPEPANRAFPWRVLIPLLAAALALLFVLPGLLSQDRTLDDPDGIRFRGDEALMMYESGPAGLVPWSGDAMGAGDTLGFRVNSTGHAAAALLSVDGNGTVTVFWDGAVEDGSDVALPLTVTLDGAPGPEVFVVVFDRDAAQAEAELRATWQAGGHQAVVEWARIEAADAVVVERR